MAVARSKSAAAALSAAVAQRKFEKEYLCLVRGRPLEEAGTYRDLLLHDRQRNKSFVVDRMRGGVKEAELDYRCLASSGGLSLVHVRLRTGRTHQIRVQFASRGTPLAGDGKYGGGPGEIALWSYRLAFPHPETGALWPSPPCPRAGCGRSSLWRHFYQLPYKCDRVVPDPLPRNGRLAALPPKTYPHRTGKAPAPSRRGGLMSRGFSSRSRRCSRSRRSCCRSHSRSCYPPQPPQQQNRMMIRMMIQQQLPPPKPFELHIDNYLL